MKSLFEICKDDNKLRTYGIMKTTPGYEQYLDDIKTIKTQEERLREVNCNCFWPAGMWLTGQHPTVSCLKSHRFYLIKIGHPVPANTARKWNLARLMLFYWANMVWLFSRFLFKCPICMQNKSSATINKVSLLSSRLQPQKTLRGRD